MSKVNFVGANKINSICWHPYYTSILPFYDTTGKIVF
jgi:hypothetical protein